VTLPLESAVDSVAPDTLAVGVPPVIVPVLPDAIVKSAGSISQVPARPAVARVSTLVVAAICMLAAEVSTKPPSPPLRRRVLVWHH
jgi:hypothetical protein